LLYKTNINNDSENGCTGKYILSFLSSSAEFPFCKTAEKLFSHFPVISSLMFGVLPESKNGSSFSEGQIWLWVTQSTSKIIFEKIQRYYLLSAADIEKRTVIVTSPGGSESSWRTSSALSQSRSTHEYWPSSLLVKNRKTERNAASETNLQYEQMYS